MGKHRAYDPSLTATIRLRIAGWWMIRTHDLANKAEDNYLQAYRAKHGGPCLKELLDAGTGTIQPTEKKS